MIRNKHHVPAIAWNSWGVVGQALFNTLYVDLRRNQDLYLHPQTLEAPPEQWKTTAWNLAWVAAETSKTVLDDVADGTIWDDGPEDVNSTENENIGDVPSLRSIQNLDGL